MHVSLATLAICISILGLSSAQTDVNSRPPPPPKTTTKTPSLTTVSTTRSTKTTSSATLTTTSAAPTCPAPTCNKSTVTSCSRTFNFFKSGCGILPDPGYSISYATTFLDGTLSDCDAIAACAKYVAKDGQPDFFAYIQDDGTTRYWICSEGYFANESTFSSNSFVKQFYAYKGVLKSSCN